MRHPYYGPAALEMHDDVRESGTYVRAEPDPRRDPLHRPDLYHEPFVVPHDRAEAFGWGRLR